METRTFKVRFSKNKAPEAFRGMSLIQRQIYTSQRFLLYGGAGMTTLSEGKPNSLCTCLRVNFACGQIWLSATETWYSSMLQAVPNSRFSIKLCINTCLAGKAFLCSVYPWCSGPSSTVPSRACPPRFTQQRFHTNRVMWDTMELLLSNCSPFSPTLLYLLIYSTETMYFAAA